MNEQMLCKFAPLDMGAGSASSRGPAAGALYSALLQRHGFRHAFFTRAGGTSCGPYQSLNFSFAVGDSNERVDANLRLAAQALDVDMTRLYFASQVHGNRVVEVTGTEEQRQVIFTEADAVVSGADHVACAVRTADCVPILLACPRSGRVAAVHAGWRGLVARVIAAAISKLSPSGAPACIAAIGPHISASAFEVAGEVAEHLRAACPGADPVVQGGAKPHVDLRLLTRYQLRAAGLPDTSIDDVPGCTYHDAERFFSYRRDGRRSGRHLSAIVAQSADSR